jgi:hypothetical protein
VTSRFTLPGMKPVVRYSEFIAIKVSPDLAKEVRRQAREDDRTVSGFLRRIIAAAVHHPEPEAPSDR